VISEHPNFSHPTDRTIALWRYMDLSKFVALLQTGKLYFARADKLGDPFEGSVTRLNSLEADFIIQNREKLGVFSRWGDYWRDISDDRVREMYKQFSEGRETFRSGFMRAVGT
jgi:hypothetical protein